MSKDSERQVLEAHDGAADQYVGEIMVAATDKGFRSLDVFVTWFTAGTAAAIGLAAANLPNLGGLISLPAIKSAMPWLGAALILVLVSKFFGSLICAVAGAADEARRIRREVEASGEAMPSPEAFFAAIEKATPWPIRYFTARGGVPLGRKVLRTLMVSGITALLAAGCVVVFWGVLLSPSRIG